jgi:hypothetical protein
VKQIDAVKLGLLYIAVLGVVIGLAGLIWGPPDKKAEIALAAMNCASLIGGWLGHAVLSGKDTGSDQPIKADKENKEVS